MGKEAPPTSLHDVYWLGIEIPVKPPPVAVKHTFLPHCLQSRTTVVYSQKVRRRSSAVMSVLNMDEIYFKILYKWRAN